MSDLDKFTDVQLEELLKGFLVSDRAKDFVLSSAKSRNSSVLIDVAIAFLKENIADLEQERAKLFPPKPVEPPDKPVVVSEIKPADAQAKEKWLTIDEIIQAGCKLTVWQIRGRIEKLDKGDSRTRPNSRKRLEVRMTDKAYELFEITRENRPVPVKPVVPAPPSTIVALDFGRKIEIDSFKNYDFLFVDSMLENIHAQAFSEEVRNRIKMAYSIGKTIPGAKLIELLKPLEGGIKVLSSSGTKRDLQVIFDDAPYTTVELYLKRPEFSRFLHTIVGILETPFLLKRENSDLCGEARKLLDSGKLHTKPGKDPRGSSSDEDDKSLPEVQVTARFKARFEQMKIWPDHDSLIKIRAMGFLDPNNRQTYIRFEAAMDGWCFSEVETLRVKKEKKGEWGLFQKQFVQSLIDSGSLKDLGNEAPNEQAVQSFYVERIDSSEVIQSRLKNGI